MSFDATTYNSIKGSYLLRMQMKPKPPIQNGGNANSANGNSSSNNSANGNNAGQQNNVDTQPPIMEEYIRQSENKKKLQERRQMLDKEKSASMHEMLQRLERSRHEVNGLRQQFATEQNPFKRMMLENQLGNKTAGTSAIEHKLASSYDAGSSGFLGSEDRVDSVDSFVTFG